MIKYHHTNEPKDCCGCRACEQICSRHAITMQENAEGYYYPVIDESSCVDCGLCEKVCPMQANQIENTNQPIFLAAQTKDKNILKKRSSGGMFTQIAIHTIPQGGVVYGAAFSESMELRHIRIDNIEGLSQLRGSKYVQSNMSNIYSMVKEDLQRLTKVYFVGTPCQVCGLKLFLRKEYTNLFTSDLVCHGVPSRKIFRTVREHLEKKGNMQMTKYSFRDKHVGGWSCSSSSSSYKSISKKQKYLVKDRQMDAYYHAFISGNIMRYSCYECPFTSPNRVSDITLADCWNIQELDTKFKETYREGVSLILINSERGKALWNEIKDHTVFDHIDKDWAMKNNPQLASASHKGNMRERTYDMALNDYPLFVDTFAPKSLKKTLKFYLAYYIRNNAALYSIAQHTKRLLK